MSARIVIFAKEPMPGRVKTRLIAELGAQGAAALAADMLERTIAEAEAAGFGLPELCGDPGEWERTPDHVRFVPQGQGDLGARLARAARRVLDEGAHPLLIGADCPSLDRERLRAAAEALASHDAVIHPAEDGGYVLLGLRRFDPSLFADIAWSTASVAATTIGRVRELGWPLHVGETLRDIDVPADLA